MHSETKATRNFSIIHTFQPAFPMCQEIFCISGLLHENLSLLNLHIHLRVDLTTKNTSSADLSLIHFHLSMTAQSWRTENSRHICKCFRLFSYLHLSRACASSKWFLRNRSRAAMQSSRASDRSDREHLKNQNKHTP